MVDAPQKPFAAYAGSGPYFFVCYSHDDAVDVYAELERLHIMGANLWYDEGITPGSEWSESLARAIQNAAALLLFVSPRSIQSKHCRDEIGYAKDNNVPVVCIYLEAAALTEGLKLSLGSSQAIMKYEVSESLYEQKLRRLLSNDEAGGAALVPEPRASRRGRLFAILLAAVALLTAGLLFYAEHAPPPDTKQLSAGRKSIAVLPFVNLSNNSENEFVADGLTDTMIYRLSQLEDLQVTARTSVFAFRGSKEDVKTIAAKLGVTTILDGSVQRYGDKIRVFAKLTDVATNDNVWSDQFDMQAQDIFLVQDQIATSVTGALKLKLLGGAAANLTTHPTENLAAYESYLRGIQFYEQFDFASLQKSAGLLEKAIELDPDFSVAYLALVRNYTTQHIAGMIDLAGMNRRVHPLLERASELDDDLGEEWALRGLVAALSGDQKGGRQTLARAIRLSPNSATATSQLGGLFAFSDKPDQAVEMTMSARVLDPLGVWPKFDTWFAAHRLGEFDQAWAAIEATAQIWDRFFQGLHLYLASGAYHEAVETFVKGIEFDPLDAEFPGYVALISMDIGDQKQAKDYVSKTLAVNPEHKMSALVAALYELESGSIEQARAIAADGLGNSMPPRFESAFMLPRILRDQYLDQGNLEQAITLYYDLYPQLHDLDLEGIYPVLTPTAMVHVALDLSLVLDLAGRPEEADSLRQAAAQMLENLPWNGLFGYALAKAEILALQGDKDGALRSMEQTLAGGWGQLWKLHTQHNRNLDAVKDEPRYHAMLGDLEARMVSNR